MTQLLPPKKEVALALLERSNVDVYLDPRAKGVVVPPQFRKEPRLILKIGLNMPVPIPDLRLDDESLSCTLSFSRSPFYCVVPWPSVFAMVGDDGRGMVWPDDVPQELAVRVAQDKDDKRDESSPAPIERNERRGKGRRVPAEESRPSLTEAGREPGDRPSRPKRNANTGAGKKKKEEPRPPMLVAVPSGDRDRDRPPAVSPVSPAPSRKGEERKGGEAAERKEGDRISKPNGRPPPSQRPGTANRPKRELPPYLRVVK